jgi:uncharacterized membrane protein
MVGERPCGIAALKPGSLPKFLGRCDKCPRNPKTSTKYLSAGYYEEGVRFHAIDSALYERTLNTAAVLALLIVNPIHKHMTASMLTRNPVRLEPISMIVASGTSWPKLPAVSTAVTFLDTSEQVQTACLLQWR